MKTKILVTISFTNGLFFLFYGLTQTNLIVLFSGLILTALALCAFLDFAKPSVFSFLNNLRAFYKLFKAAPSIVEKAEMFDQVVHKLDLIEHNNFMLEKLSPVATLASSAESFQQEEIEGRELRVNLTKKRKNPDLGPIMSATSDSFSRYFGSSIANKSFIPFQDEIEIQEKRSIEGEKKQQKRSLKSQKNKMNGEKRRGQSKKVDVQNLFFFAHEESISADAASIITSFLPLFQMDEKLSNLVVTDIGLSEVNEDLLKLFLNDEIRMDFWISKKIIGGCDLLVIPAKVFITSPELVSEALVKLAFQYAMVATVAKSDTVQVLKELTKPSTQRLLEVN